MSVEVSTHLLFPLSFCPSLDITPRLPCFQRRGTSRVAGFYKEERRGAEAGRGDKQLRGEWK